MKKRILSLLTAVCLMLSLAPAALAVDAVTDLQTAIDAVEAGGTVTLTGDVTLTGSLTIDKAVTIDGTAAKYAITYNGASAAAAAFNITTNDQVTLENLVLNAKNINGRGIKLSGTSPKFTFENSTMNVGDRGIWVDTNGCDAASVITVSNSVIQNSRLPVGKTYDNWASCNDTRGISLWDLNDSEVNITDSSILGFGYTINLAGTPNTSGTRDFNNTAVNVTGSTLKGWAAINVWSINTTYNITASDLVGVNVAASGQNGFSTIVLNNGIYGSEMQKDNVFNITDGSIEAYYYGGSENIHETLIQVEAEGQTKFNFAIDAELEIPMQVNDATYGVFVTATPGMSDAALAGWFANNVTGWGVVVSNVPAYVGYTNRSVQKPYIPHEGGMIG